MSKLQVTRRKEGWVGESILYFTKRQVTQLYFTANGKSPDKVLSFIDLVARFTLSDGDILEDYCCERSGKDFIKI